jgi:hypothetical protein
MCSCIGKKYTDEFPKLHIKGRKFVKFFISAAYFAPVLNKYGLEKLRSFTDFLGVMYFILQYKYLLKFW